MEWISDYARWCLELGVGGITLLVLSGLLAFNAVMLVLVGAQKAGQAFMRGWRAQGEIERAKTASDRGR